MTTLNQDIDLMSAVTDYINDLVDRDGFIGEPRVRHGVYDTIYPFGNIGFAVSVDRREIKDLTSEALLSLVKQRTMMQLLDIQELVADSIEKLGGPRATVSVQGL